MGDSCGRSPRLPRSTNGPRRSRVGSGPDPTRIPLCRSPLRNWTFGEKSVLWIRADFSDEPGVPATDAGINAAMARVSEFFLDVSNVRSSFRTVILPGALRLSKTMAVHNTDPVADLGIRAEAVALARAYDAANGNAGTYNPDRYDRWIAITKRLASLGVSGRGSVGTAGLFMNGSTSAYIVAHGLGHNHGLQHAGWKPAGLPRWRRTLAVRRCVYVGQRVSRAGTSVPKPRKSWVIWNLRTRRPSARRHVSRLSP